MFSLLLAVQILLFILSSCQETRLENTIDINYIRENFDWRAFIELYPECLSQGVNDEEKAINYYLKQHHAQNPYRFPHKLPIESTLITAKQKLTTFLELSDQHSVPPERRTLIIYHVGWLITENSFDVTINNIKLFVNAMLDDSLSSLIGEGKPPRAFYWINLLGGKENLLYKYLPDHEFLKSFNNIALLEWNLSPSDMYTHFRTLEIISSNSNNVNVDSSSEAFFVVRGSTLLKSSFSMVLFLNNEARGPLIQRYNGEWIDTYQNLLNEGKNVLVGSILSCEVKPHIQTHTFAIKSIFIPYILEQYRYGTFYKVKYWRYIVKHYEIGLSNLALMNNFTIASLLYQHRRQETSFNGKCLIRERRSGFVIDSNPIRWCKLPMKEVIFMKWGGSPFRKTGFICPTIKSQMDELLGNITIEYRDYYDNLMSSLTGQSTFQIRKEKQIEKEIYYLQNILTKDRFKLQVQFTTPETLRGGILFDLYKQYDAERILPFHPLALSKEAVKESLKSSPPSNVCLFTNIYGILPFHLPKRRDTLNNSKTKDPWNEAFVINFLQSEFDQFIQSLNRQVDPNWMVYLISSKLNLPSRNTVKESNLTSEIWEKNELNYDEIMQTFFHHVSMTHHPRIRFILLPKQKEFRSTLSVYDTMLLELQSDSSMMSHCQWAMFSSIFKKFGSQVISNIRSVPPSEASSFEEEEVPSMVIVPMDSKRFVYQDLNNRILPFWNLHCLHYLSFINNHPSGFFAQFIPTSEQIDIAAVAFPFHLLLRETLLFDNFTQFGYRNYLKVSSLRTNDPIDTKNNPDMIIEEKSSPYSHLYYDPIYEEMMISSHFVQHLARYRRWNYVRLSLDGLKSMIVDVDAPTHCLASGNVWYDHPISSLSGCYTTSQVDRLHILDLKNRKIGFSFDWKGFERNNRMCLRLNKDLYYKTMANYPILRKYIPAKFKSQVLPALPIVASVKLNTTEMLTSISENQNEGENDNESVEHLSEFIPDGPSQLKRGRASRMGPGGHLRGKAIQATLVYDRNNPEESRKVHQQYERLKEQVMLFQPIKKEVNQQ